MTEFLREYICGEIIKHGSLKGTSCGKILCNKHYSYAEEDYLIVLDKIFEREGFEGLSFERLKQLRVYYGLYKFGWNAEKICNRYGMDREEWKKKRGDRLVKSSGNIRWKEERVWDIWEELVSHYDYVPTANEIRKEFPQYGAIFAVMGNFGISYDDVRDKYPNNKYGPRFGQMKEDIEKPAGGMANRARWTESVNGMRWHSRAEASVSNFFYARGIKHKKGELYPEEYAEITGYARGWYDIHFETPCGKIIDVEIWGDINDVYLKRKEAKIKFNEGRDCFIGIHWEDCYDNRLEEIFEPFIGNIEPFVFDKPEHELIQTAFWSNAEELIETCRWLAKKQPDGRFPTEHWLRKRGEYENREGETYNTIGVYIQKYLGGLINLRTILGEDISHYRRWDKESSLLSLDEWLQEYGISPQAYHIRFKKHGEGDEKIAKYASSLTSAILKHCGKLNETIVKLGYWRENRLSHWKRNI